MEEDNNHSRTYIVIAAYNEEKSLPKVIETLVNHGYTNIVAVDDGSTDHTIRVSRAKADVLDANIHLLTHIVNRGQGAALKTGIDFAIDQDAQVVVTFDADGQHDAKEIASLVKPVLAGKADVVLGSRFIGKKTKVPKFKRMVLKGGILFTWLFSGKRLTDTHNGFRALSRKAAQQIEIKQDRMEHASEIIDEICRKNISFKEVPVTIAYTDYSRKKGQSSFNSIKIATKLVLRKLIK
jgi:polyprenyl-phospho-N-acetylgalactosaminyl synthase